MCSIASCASIDTENKFGPRQFVPVLTIGGFGVVPNALALPPSASIGGFLGEALFYYVTGVTGHVSNPPYVWSTTVAGASALATWGLHLLPTGVLEGVVPSVLPAPVTVPIRATDCKGCHVDAAIAIIHPPS